MYELTDSSLVETSVSSTRTKQEEFCLYYEGNNRYASAACFIENNQEQIDIFARFCSRLTSFETMNFIRERTYRNEKNSAFINFINRNLYQGAKKTGIRQTQEQIAGTIAGAAMEGIIKSGAGFFYNYALKKANDEMIETIYFFLRDYAMIQDSEGDMERAEIEISKIRNSLPYTRPERLLEKSDARSVIPLSRVTGMQPVLNNDKVREAVAYQLFSVYYQKYGDNEESILPYLRGEISDFRGIKTLLGYYSFLGYHGKNGQELLQENARNYNEIARDQIQCLNLSREIVRETSLKMQGLDLRSTHERCVKMSKYDPYKIRRTKIQKVGGGACEIAAGYLLERPDIVLNGAALALSQFELEDGNASEIVAKEMKRNGIGLEVFDIMLSQAKVITEKAVKAVKMTKADSGEVLNVT